MFKRMPIPLSWVIVTGILLGLVIGFKSLIPFMYWGDMAEYNWYKSALPHILNYLFWPFLVPFIYWTFQRFDIGKGALLKDRGIAVLMSLSVPLVHEAVTTFIYFVVLEWANVYEFTDETWLAIRAAFPGVYIGRIVEFWIIYGLFAAFDYYRQFKNKQSEVMRMEAQLNSTKLAVLKMQLQPHFLFNALNSISSLMDTDVKKAQNMTARLGDLLRGILRQDERQFITLEEELDYVRNYLEIEYIRFGDRLKISYSIDTKLLQSSIPVLMLQTLVENSIKHGLAKISDEGHITIEVTEKPGGTLHVVIRNSGPSLALDEENFYSNGIGLRNVKDRLSNLYPGQHHFNVDRDVDGTFTAIISIPIRSTHESN